MQFPLRLRPLQMRHVPTQVFPLHRIRRCQRLPRKCAPFVGTQLHVNTTECELVKVAKVRKKNFYYHVVRGPHLIATLDTHVSVTSTLPLYGLFERMRQGVHQQYSLTWYSQIFLQRNTFHNFCVGTVAFFPKAFAYWIQTSHFMVF